VKKSYTLSSQAVVPNKRLKISNNPGGKGFLERKGPGKFYAQQLFKYSCKEATGTTDPHDYYFPGDSPGAKIIAAIGWIRSERVYLEASQFPGPCFER